MLNPENPLGAPLSKYTYIYIKVNKGKVSQVSILSIFWQQTAFVNMY